jgi:hypothetical protein
MSLSTSSLILYTLLAPLGSTVGQPAGPDVKTSRVTFLGWAREVSRAWSASRDAPAFNLTAFPRDVRTAAGEFALVTIPTARLTVRMGFNGLIELEREGETRSFDSLFPRGTGPYFWRGAYGYYVAASFGSWARRLCGRCGLEAGLMLRHESEHYTGSNSGGEGLDFSDRPLVGDLLLLDAAARWASEKWVLVGRVQNEFFIPGRSSYSQGPGIDLHVRYKARESLHLFASGFAEVRLGTEFEGRAYPDAYLVRGHLGVALPSRIGDVQVYLSGDVGHRKGLLAFSEERTLGLGFRLALGPISGG